MPGDTVKDRTPEMTVNSTHEAYPTPTKVFGLSSYLGWSISKCFFTSCSTAAFQGTTAAYIILSTASNMSYKDTHRAVSSLGGHAN